jgi:putative transposase
MKTRRTAEEIVRLLRDMHRDLAKGLTVVDVCRKHGVGDSTHYRWRERHEPGKVDNDRRYRELESENARLEKLVADLLLDKQMLQLSVSSKCPAQTSARMARGRNGAVRAPLKFKERRGSRSPEARKEAGDTAPKRCLQT